MGLSSDSLKADLEAEFIVPVIYSEREVLRKAVGGCREVEKEAKMGAQPKTIASGIPRGAVNHKLQHLVGPP